MPVADSPVSPRSYQILGQLRLHGHSWKGSEPFQGTQIPMRSALGCLAHVIVIGNLAASAAGESRQTPEMQALRMTTVPGQREARLMSHSSPRLDVAQSSLP